MIESSTLLRLITGWALLLASVVAPAISSGVVVVNTELGPATVLASLSLIFLFLLYPRIGSPYELRSLFSGVTLFLSLLALSSHALASRGEGLISKGYALLRDSLVKLGQPFLGDTASLLTPLYLSISIILLLTFAYRSIKGFVFVLTLVALNGLYPMQTHLLIGYLFCFSGFWLIQDDVIYLPRRLQERLILIKNDKDMLLELRNSPIGVSRAVLLFTGGRVADLQSLTAEEQERMRLLASTGLIEVDVESKVFHPSELLRKSHLAPGVHDFVNVLSIISSIIVFVPCIIYIVSPIDFIPEALLPGVGYIDDIILAFIGSMPLVANGPYQLREAFSALHNRRKEQRDKLMEMRLDSVVDDAQQIPQVPIKQPIQASPPHLE